MGMRLEVIAGNAAGTTILVEDALVIGRHADGPGRLSEDPEISRQHARISRELTGDYAIEDLGSSNGTFVNGLRIDSPRLLAAGDSIETGATTLVVRDIVRGEGEGGSPAAGEALAGAAGEASAVEPSAALPPLALSLEVDFQAREARIALGGDGDTVRIVFADGRWQVAT